GQLRLKNPDQRRGYTFTLAEVHSAALWLFQDERANPSSTTNSSIAATTGGSSFQSFPVSSSTAAAPPSALGAPDTLIVKREDLNAMFGRFHMQATAPRPPMAPGTYQAPPGWTQNNGLCHYCNEPGHIASRCETANKDLAEGLIARNYDNKIVLPTGHFLPREYRDDLAGMRNRFIEWHAQHPGNRRGPPALNNDPNQGPGPAPATQMMLEVSPVEQLSQYSLFTRESRIEALKHEIEVLSQMDTAVVEGRMTRSGARAVGFVPPPANQYESDEPVPRQATPGPAPAQAPVPEVVRNAAPIAPVPPMPRRASPGPRATSEPPSSAQARSQVPAQGVPLITHPYSLARDATYQPPAQRVMGAPSKPAGQPQQQTTYPSTNQAAYRTRPPAYNQEVIQAVYERSLNASSITISHKELLAVSPEVTNKYREYVTPIRKPPVPTVATHAYMEEIDEETDEVIVSTPKVVRFVDDDPVVLPFVPGVMAQELVPVPEAPEPVDVPDFSPDEYATTVTQVEGEDNQYYVSCPYDTYLSGLPPGAVPKPLKTGGESHHLRCIRSKVNNREEVDCILDGGSQIISMSEATCHALSLPYDPATRMSMQSANGTTDTSLGLCRNVPFSIGHIIVYLQVHVIRAAAYDILVGRPFDVLTASLIQNYTNEEQTITITCPNSGIKTTLPTFPRTRPKFSMPMPVKNEHSFDTTDRDVTVFRSSGN
ncbi:hypothetical protein EUX98_g9152, partial [Antrodiella citrinella]